MQMTVSDIYNGAVKIDNAIGEKYGIDVKMV
jgi:hypothetical protein